MSWLGESKTATDLNIPAPLAAVDELTTRRDQLRDRVRAEIGISPEIGSTGVRSCIADEGLTMYPLIALGLLAMVDQFQSQAFALLAPDISRALGLSIAVIASARTLQFVAQSIAPLPVAAAVQHGRRRAVLVIVTGVVWSLITMFTGFVTSLVALLVILVADGLTTGSVATVHPSLLVDWFPTRIRTRILSGYASFQAATYLVLPLLVALCTGVFGLTWRGVFLATGFVSLISSLVAVKLRDPGYGRFDTERVRSAVRDGGNASPPSAIAPDSQLSFAASFRRLLAIPTVHRLAMGFLMFGAMQVPFATFMSFFLQQRWNLDITDRSLLSVLNAGLAIAVLLALSRRMENIFRRNPGRAVNVAGLSLACSLVLIAGSVLSPVFVGMVVFSAAGSALLFVMLPPLLAVLTSVVRADLRLHLGALLGLFLAAGSILGLLFLSELTTQVGTGGAIVALSLPGIVGALIIRSARHLVGRDIDRMLDGIVESEEISQMSAAGRHLPLLACRGLCFSYGQMQVLFDIDFAVEEGELVALLGVNGAGKSTLLRVVSGLGLPSEGTVRLSGSDITFVDPELRVRSGIVQVQGGRTVFGPLTVLENLRYFSWALGRHKAEQNRAIERAFEAFPELEGLDARVAAALSGGQQQMLSLAKAVMLRPKLLLIDELSLGLAPAVVDRLLGIVRELNREGTAVVVVEQSVNIALDLAHHAYFMEKGEIRFDGRSEDLIQREDLLRAVFLGGSTAAGRP
jgi:ABC-type branched-subunit amino acid transport system ATPase component/MFS family permease